MAYWKVYRLYIGYIFRLNCNRVRTDMKGIQTRFRKIINSASCSLHTVTSNKLSSDERSIKRYVLRKRRNICYKHFLWKVLLKNSIKLYSKKKRKIGFFLTGEMWTKFHFSIFVPPLPKYPSGSALGVCLKILS